MTDAVPIRSTATFRPDNQGPRGLWFIVTFENGEVVSFEEHDGYQGGPMGIPRGKSPATYLMDRVLARGGRWDEAQKFCRPEA